MRRDVCLGVRLGVRRVKRAIGRRALPGLRHWSTYPSKFPQVILGPDTRPPSKCHSSFWHISIRKQGCVSQAKEENKDDSAIVPKGLLAIFPSFGEFAGDVNNPTTVVGSGITRFPAPHSLPLTSAFANTFCGMVKPICLAALRLIIKLNLFAGSIGMSRGLAPFNILSTYVAARRNRSR